jgi:hypothetical protein
MDKHIRQASSVSRTAKIPHVPWPFADGETFEPFGVAVLRS